VTRLRERDDLVHPNVRPAIMHSPDEVLGRVEELVALSDV